jgi:uncharacterized protein YecT (DUF1311 family)
VVVAIFLFALTARLIAYLIPDGHAKKLVIIIDDAILLAVFALAGYRLLNYMWIKPHAEAGPGEPVEVGEIGQHPDKKRDASDAGTTLAQCRALIGAHDDLSQCLERKMVQSQQALNQSSGRMLAEMKSLDKVGSAKIGARETFEAAQQAFLRYREAECKWRSATVTAGSADDAYKTCMADLAMARTERIRRLLK